MLTGAYQFGHGVGGFTINFIHSFGTQPKPRDTHRKVSRPIGSLVSALWVAGNAAGFGGVLRVLVRASCFALRVLHHRAAPRAASRHSYCRKLRPKARWWMVVCVWCVVKSVPRCLHHGAKAPRVKCKHNDAPCSTISQLAIRVCRCPLCSLCDPKWPSSAHSRLATNRPQPTKASQSRDRSNLPNQLNQLKPAKTS